MNNLMQTQGSEGRHLKRNVESGAERERLNQLPECKSEQTQQKLNKNVNYFFITLLFIDLNFKIEERKGST